MSRRSRTLRFKLLLVVALLIVVAWSVMWFVAATIVERQVERSLLAANAGGAVTDCANREVTGFPFRIELRCGAGTHAVTNAMTAKVDGLTVAALVYKPSQIIAEMRGPVSLHAAGLPPMSADWNLAHASARLDLGEQKVRRVDAELLAPTLTVGTTPMTVGEVDLNVRQDPDDPAALNFSLRIDELATAVLAGPADFAVRGTLAEGAALLNGSPDRLLAALAAGGAPVVIDALTLDHGDMALAAAGELRVGADGLLNGNVELAIAGEEIAARYIEVVTPGAGDTAVKLVQSLLKNTPANADIGGRPAKSLSLTVTDGRVRVGAFPFPLPFQIPPVRFAAR